MTDLNEGIRCQGCGMREGKCARIGHSCCAACTHTFDGGATRKFLCFGCNRIITHDTKKLPESGMCRLCSLLKNQGVKVAERPACVPSIEECEQADPPQTEQEERPGLEQVLVSVLPNYHWYVTYTGMAHLWSSAGLSYCGMVRYRPGGASVTDWEPKCKKCAGAWQWQSIQQEPVAS